MSQLSAQEVIHVLSVERDLHAAEERLSAQLLLIADLRRGGRDTAQAENRLRMILAARELLKTHLSFLRDRLAPPPRR